MTWLCLLSQVVQNSECHLHPVDKTIDILKAISNIANSIHTVAVKNNLQEITTEVYFKMY